jgi:hypothetical protein
MFARHLVHVLCTLKVTSFPCGRLQRDIVPTFEAGLARSSKSVIGKTSCISAATHNTTAEAPRFANLTDGTGLAPSYWGGLAVQVKSE